MSRSRFYAGKKCDFAHGPVELRAKRREGREGREGRRQHAGGMPDEPESAYVAARNLERMRQKEEGKDAVEKFRQRRGGI